MGKRGPTHLGRPAITLKYAADTCTYCNVPFVYPTLLSYRGQGSSAALHMESLAVGSLYQAACDRAYHGVIAIGHW